MPKFRLSADVTVSAFTDIVAATLEEAIELSKDRQVVIGGNQSGEDPSESWIIEEADGDAENIRL